MIFRDRPQEGARSTDDSGVTPAQRCGGNLLTVPSQRHEVRASLFPDGRWPPSPMKLINRTNLLSLAVAGSLCACDSLPTDIGSLTGQSSGGGSGMVDAMKDQPTMFLVQLPPNPAVGQWWEYSMGGGAIKQHNAIVAAKDGMFVVEQCQDMGGTMVVNAWLVDPSVDLMAEVSAGQKMSANVSQAWIGAEGGKPMERPVMDVPMMPEATGDAPEIDFTEGTERVSMAGNTWNAKWVERSGAKSWMVDGTAFMLKSEAGGTVAMELTGWGTDAEPALDWAE